MLKHCMSARNYKYDYHHLGPWFMGLKFNGRGEEIHEWLPSNYTLSSCHLSPVNIWFSFEILPPRKPWIQINTQHSVRQRVSQSEPLPALWHLPGKWTDLPVQQPGVGGHGACSSLQQSVGNYRGRTSIVFCCCSLSHVQLFAAPWMAACQASLSFTVSQSLLKLLFIELMMPSNRLILCCPLLLLPLIFPSIRVFSNELVLHIKVLELCFGHAKF